MKRSSLWIAVCGAVLVLGSVAVAQVGETLDDPKVPATADPVLRDAAVDAILVTDFGSATTPTLPPPTGQLMSGSTQDFVEIAPHVWFGLSGPRKPPEKGFFFVRRTASNVLVSVPTPEPFSVAASNGTEVVAFARGGVYAASIASVQGGAPVWTLRVAAQGAPYDGFRSGSYTGPEGSEEVSRSALVCYKSTCMGYHFGGFVEPGSEVGWLEPPDAVNFLTFDGFVTSTDDKDSRQQYGPMSAGDGVLQQSVSGTRSAYSTDDIPDEYILHRVRPDGQEARYGHWSNIRNQFVGVLGNTVVAWLPDTGASMLLATEPAPLLDALELPDGTLVSLRCVRNDVVVKRGTQETSLGSLPCDDRVGFSQYHSGDFLTIESHAGMQGTTLWSSYDTARTWTPAPPNGTPIVTPTPVQAAHASNRFTLSGSGHTVTGPVTAKTVALSGSSHKLTGGVKTQNPPAISGSNHVVNPTAEVVGSIPAAVNPKFVDFDPNSPNAATLGTKLKRVPISNCPGGTWNPTATALTAGSVYVVPCNVKISGANAQIAASLIASGSVTISGAGTTITPGAAGFHAIIADENVTLSGARTRITGPITASQTISLAGTQTQPCTLTAQNIEITGSRSTITTC